MTRGVLFTIPKLETREYNSHFRVAYIAPEKHREMLQEISDRTISYADKPTRILLSNIEDNKYSIFNQFVTLNASTYKTPGRIYIGEPLSVSNSMAMDFSRSEYSNLLMIGGDTEKARSMFAFSILSLCINYKVIHQQAPKKPFIYLFNCKPLDDSYFKDTSKLLAEFLPEYIQYVGCEDTNEIQSIVSQMYEIFLTVQAYLKPTSISLCLVIREPKNSNLKFSCLSLRILTAYLTSCPLRPLVLDYQ